MSYAFDTAVKIHEAKVEEENVRFMVTLAIHLKSALHKVHRYLPEITGVCFSMGSWYFIGTSKLKDDEEYMEKKSCAGLVEILNYIEQEFGNIEYDEVNLEGVVFILRRYNNSTVIHNHRGKLVKKGEMEKDRDYNERKNELMKTSLVKQLLHSGLKLEIREG